MAQDQAQRHVDIFGGGTQSVPTKKDVKAPDAGKATASIDAALAEAKAEDTKVTKKAAEDAVKKLIGSESKKKKSRLSDICGCFSDW